MCPVFIKVFQQVPLENYLVYLGGGVAGQETRELVRNLRSGLVSGEVKM